jgi:RNA polymerase sigma factor (TIGR02999 family)
MTEEQSNTEQPASDTSKESNELLEQVYQELRALAAARLSREAPGHTLQATALVHEAWIELSKDSGRTWKNKAHFVGFAAEAMRRILIDSARRRSRLKRGGKSESVGIHNVEIADDHEPEEILTINFALEQLEREDPAQARIVVMKFFGGMTNEEVAAFLGISERTVYRHWVCAKARLSQWVRQAEGVDHEQGQTS